jgi:1-acyl-sn-glycerol-3-phosphate acyltransferase
VKYLARAILRLGGWRIEGAKPDLEKYVLVAAPHTSNWDFLWMICMAYALEIRVSWLGKDALFNPLVGWFFRLLGGIPVDRSAPSDLVSRLASRFASSKDLVLLVPVEGTRSHAPHWKSGFYHIAGAARVPVVLGFLDYAKCTGGFGPTVVPTGDVASDMNVVRGFYAGIAGKFPALASPVRLKDELTPNGDVAGATESTPLQR